jgi:hypothetical protein
VPASGAATKAVSGRKMPASVTPASAGKKVGCRSSLICVASSLLLCGPVVAELVHDQG